MKSVKADVKQKPKSSLKEFRRSVAAFLVTKKWLFLSVLLITISLGLVLFLSGPVPVRAQIISQTWDSLNISTHETKYQSGFMNGTAEKISMSFYKQNLEQNISMQISSPNITVYDISDYYQPPAIGYSKELGGYYLSLRNLTNGQTFDISFNDGLANLQGKLINLSNSSNLELRDAENSSTDIDTPSLLLIANGSLSFHWDLPIDCYFNILNWKDTYTNNFPSLNISSQCMETPTNRIDLQMTQYLPEWGTRAILVTNRMNLLGGGDMGNQNKQYLLVLDRADNYSKLGVEIVASSPMMDFDVTYEPENITNNTEYLSFFNPGYFYSISNSVGKIKLGSQTISTDEYSDVDIESKNGNFSIDILGSAGSTSSPFIISSRTLTSSLKINFDEMIKTRWSVFPTEIWSAIIGGLMTILGTYIGYILGKRKSALS